LLLCRSKLGLYEKAIEDCNAALDAHPNHLKALLRRAHSNSKVFSRISKFSFDTFVNFCCDQLSQGFPLFPPHNCRTYLVLQLERWKDALRDYERLKRELPGDAEVARSYFDAQVALKKHHGEETLPKWFGGEIEDITSNDQLRESLSHPGTHCEPFSYFIFIG
jgi:tetratricopeptide (TPR) repeat protein